MGNSIDQISHRWPWKNACVATFIEFHQDLGSLLQMRTVHCSTPFQATREHAAPVYTVPTYHACRPPSQHTDSAQPTQRRAVGLAQTPQDLVELGSRTGLDADSLVRASRLSAKVDNTCVQDGFGIYLHAFLVTREGKWAVVQQGMNPENSLARRYHWHSARVKSFVSDPHAAVVGENEGLIINMSDGQAEPARTSTVEFAGQQPQTQLREIHRLLADPQAFLVLPARHEVRVADVDPRRLGAVLALAHDRQCADFTELLLLEGLGPRTMQSLAMVSEVIYGASTRFRDPARFSFAHGGKDGHPFPVPLTIYDESIRVLRRAVEKARLGRTEQLDGLKKLSALARRIEHVHDPRADIEAVIRRERRQAHRYGGRTVFRKDARTSGVAAPEQVELFGPEPSDS